MEKVFKRIHIFLSYLLIFTTASLIFAIPPYIKAEKRLNFFSSVEIAENIKNMELNMTSIIYVKNSGGQWEEYQRLHGDENRIWVSIDNMPENLKNAFIAIEDEDFYSHKGVDWKRTVGAAGNFIFKFDDTEFGGSTITQQLIKNITQDNGRNAYRKVREIVRATLIDGTGILNKTQILEAYLNTIALGNGICGVQVAANYYFNKDVKDLTLAECACLAAITKNPSKFNPITSLKNNTDRRNTVLKKMLSLGMISNAEYSVAYFEGTTLDISQKNNYESKINNYFVDALIEQFIKDYSAKYNCSEKIASTALYNGGYKIYSTLNPEIQEAMEKVYTDTKKYFNVYGKDAQGNKVHAQSAMTIMDYSGHIVGLVGGAGEKTTNRGLNRAIDSPRQPGSTMKPLGVYALAVEKNLVHYTSKVVDEPIKNYYPDGKSGPKEWWKGGYKGEMTLDYAVRKSANTIPVKLLQKIGIEESYDFVKNKLHFENINERDKNLAALALGGCSYGITTTESAAAFAIFGNQGVYHSPTTYYKVEKMNGETVLEYQEKGEQVISPATATIMNHLLQGVVYGGEGTASGIRGFNYSMKAYAKTGTSSEAKDLWMVAGSPYYIGSVWYGFDLQQRVSVSSSASAIWRNVMKEVHKDLPKKSFEDSDDVYKKGIGYYKNNVKVDNILYAEKNPASSSSESSSSSVSSATSSVTSSEASSSQVSSSTPSTPPTPSQPAPQPPAVDGPGSTTNQPSDTTQ